MPPGIDHGKINARLTARLVLFVEDNQLGEIVTGDAGVWIESDPDTVRGPDIAFFSPERMAPGVSIPGYSRTLPDLVVEIVSPNDRAREVYDKARMWLSHGVRLVWVVRPGSRTVDVHRGDVGVEVIGGDGALDGGDVLPGFSCPVGEIFPPAE